MKSMTTNILALTTALFGLQLSAANPVAIWDGDFTTATKGGYTLDSNGNTVATDGSTITIGSKGVKITFSEMSNGVTVMYKYSDLSTGKEQAIATVKSSTKGNAVGVELTSNNKTKGIWEGASWGSEGSSFTASSGMLALTYKHDGGTYAYSVANGSRTQIYGSSSLKSADYKPQGVNVGGMDTSLGATGMKITSIAVFNSVLSESDMKSYKFPSDMPHTSVISVNLGTSGRDGTESWTVSAGTDPGAVYADSNWYNAPNPVTDNMTVGRALLSCKAKNNWSNSGQDKAYNKGYLDDGTATGITGPSITVSNLKNGYYNLVIYCSSDDANRFSYKTVNGKNYTHDSTTGAAKEGTESWGSNDTGKTEPGNHALLIKNLQVTDGTIAISSVRKDESSTKVRGCISAIQIAEVPYEATVTGDTNWANLTWTPATPPSGADVKLINNGGTGVTTVTLDGAITVGKLTVESAAGKELKIANFATKMTATSYDFSKAPGGVGLDVSTGYTVEGENPLRRYIRDNNVKVKFYGSGEKGVSIVNGYDLNRAIQGHWIFNGGKHSMTYGNGVKDATVFGANASLDNPTILVKSGTTLDFKGKDLCGWSGAADMNGVIKVEDGGRINMKDDSSTVDGGTVYYRQRIALNPGAEFYIDMAANNFRLQGGTDSDKEQLYVPAGSGTAYIKPADASRDSIYLAKDETRGFGVFVGTGSTLDIQTKIACYEDSSNKNNFEIAKRGTGTLKLSGDISGYWNQGYDGAVVKFSMYAGDMELAMAQAVKCQIWFQSGTNLKLTGNETDISGYLDGPGKVVCNSTGTVTISRAENTYTGGTEIRSGTLKIGGAASLGTGTITFAGGTLDLNGQTLTGKTISGSGTIVNSSNTAASINGVSVAAGKSYTITEGKFSIIVPEGETLTLTALPPNGMVTIGGAGKVAYTTSGTNPAYPTWTWIAEGDDAWTGTYKLSGFNGVADATTCGSTGWNPTTYYNGTNSVFEFNGTVTGGYFCNVPFSVGELVLPKGKSITFTDGHTSEQKGGPVNNYCFTKLSGEGSITINTSSSASPGVKISDVSAFAGTIRNASSNSDGNGYRVILGEGLLTAEGDAPTKAAIHFTGAAVLRSVQFYATRGSIAHEGSVVTVADNALPNFYTGALTFANGSELAFATKNGTVTANAGVTVESNVTVPVTIMDTTDFTTKTLVVWNSNQKPSGNFDLLTGSGAAKGTSGFKASKNDTNLTAIADTSKTYYEVEGGETTTTFDNQWLTDAGVTGSKTEEVQEKLDTPNANGIKMSDVYLMGYEAAEAQNAAVILKPDQAQSNGETISLSVAGVPNETRNGAVVTYTAQSSADRNWENPTEKAMDTLSVDMELPTSGVLYYRVQATVALP